MPANRLLPVIALMLGSVVAAGAGAEPTVRVLSDRTPAHLEGLFEHYEKTRGVHIEAVFVDEGLIPRLQSRPTEADLAITKTADLLAEAKQQNLLRPFESQTIVTGIAPEYRDADNAFVTISYRPRAVFASRERVEPGSVST